MTVAETVRFTGKERDSETGLDYFNARYFSGAQGRFTSADSPGYASLRHPQAWNLYSYALNNPLKFIDPDGHTVVCTGKAEECKNAAAAASANPDAAKRVGTATTTTRHSFLGISWTTSKTTVTISGDMASFRALGQNASRLADLVSDKREFGLNASSSTYKGEPNSLSSWFTAPGQRPLYGGGQSVTPTQGFYPASFIDPNPATYFIDSDAQASGIPPSGIGEKAAHEFLGHLWGEMIAGHPAGSQQNKQDSLDAENAVRRLDPKRGQKQEHH
jgi:RHS repeat-associated protein